MAETERPSLASLAELLVPPRRPINRLLDPVFAFASHQLAGAALLLLATAVAVVWANSPWKDVYHHLLHEHLAVGFGGLELDQSLHHWINDGLMGVFFFLVGLEIKRELIAGELSSVRKATLPAVAAVGGMVVPALLYAALNADGTGAPGWGIPMATDIAFALGVLALLGDRCPLGLKVFLTGVAIVDDIGAVLVIAMFYTSSISVPALLAGLLCFGCSVVMNLLGVRAASAYLFFGILAWLGFLESGVHATIAALLMAFAIPARTQIDGADLIARMRALTNHLERVGPRSLKSLNTHEEEQVLEQMHRALEHAGAPLQRIEHAIIGPCTFVVLPVFALANAGVELHGSLVSDLLHPIPIGIIVGLCVGKTTGVTLFTWLALRMGIADLPRGVRMPHVVGAGMLSGIGFTMALFVTSLAFADPALVEQAKVGVLCASLIAGLLGLSVLRRTRETAAQS